jgi:hypothetical protein
VVDDAGVDDPGTCKVESWGQGSSRSDMVGVASPTCSFDIIQPVELNAQLSRFRIDGEWGTLLTSKAKTRLHESGNASAAVSVATAFDLLTGGAAAAALNVPFTYEIDKQWKINVNAGWLWNIVGREHAFLWGAGLEYAVTDAFKLIGEVFGVVGADAQIAGMQAGLRFTPIPALDFDFIYGHNLFGEGAHWFTFGINVRFDAPWKVAMNGRR